jgi:hypothetical protein
MINNSAGFDVLTTINSIGVPVDLEKIHIYVTPIKHQGRLIIFGKSNANELMVLFSTTEDLNQLHHSPKKLTETISLSVRTLQDPVTNLSTQYLELKFANHMDPILVSALIEELFSLIVTPGDFDLLTGIPQLINRWRKMLTFAGSPKLTLGEIIGLAGELYFMNFIETALQQNCLKHWTGYSGSRHDFEFESSSIEIKASLQRSRNEITIHGFNQLASFENKKLYIVLVKCELEPYGKSLVDLVTELVSRHQVQKSDVFEKLLSAGYDIASANSYDDFRFNFTEFYLYEIDANFPALLRENLTKVSNLARVKDLQYILDVSGLEIAKGKKLDLLELHQIL